MVLLPSVGVEAGQQLCEARQRRGLTLDDISRATKIPVPLLQAIEHNDFARLPQQFFTRAFVRTYATEVGLDADHILESFRDAAIDDVRLDSPGSAIPVHEPAASKSLLMVIGICAAWTMFYSGYASRVPAPVVADEAVSTRPVQADPIATVSNSSPCPGTPPVAEVKPVRRKDTAAARTSSAPPAIPVTHVVEDAPVEPAASAIEPTPGVLDAVLPQPDVPASPAPVEQF